jgi:two-component system phosphate regulon sensor histidine kinase PhoR
VTFLITFFVTLVSAIAMVIFVFASQNTRTWSFFLFTAILFFINFFLIRLMLEQYVFRRIKLIYKIINDNKKEQIGKGLTKFHEKSIADVNANVVEWATSTKKEIAALKSLEEYRKNYVGNISHELKTPIFTVQAYLHTLLDGGIHDENINIKYLKRAAENVERLQNIVEDLDVISKLESGQFELDMRHFDIKELVSETFMDLQPIAKEKKIKLIFKEGAAQPYQVLGDKDSIRQVMTNLLVNSIKYGNQQGITKVSFYDMDKKILIEVSDNGIGIDEKHLKHLFDRFYRVDTSRSRKQGGSGLGLSIVKHIIEAHGQTIKVRSTPNIGTTFGFTLQKAKKKHMENSNTKSVSLPKDFGIG